MFPPCDPELLERPASLEELAVLLEYLSAGLELVRVSYQALLYELAGGTGAPAL